ncbi:MAG: nitroreductase [Chloroflexi bacterium]|nr:nitroreductase [Chloroflexota bacterium]
MELLEGIKTRKSYRAFKPTPVPKEMIEKVLEAAGRSPSYTNTQPWHVAVVSGKKRDDLSRILLELSGADTPSNPDLPMPGDWPPELEKRAAEHGARRFKALGVEREDKAARKELRLANFRFYGAPCALFLFADRTATSWSIFDMGLFAQSLSLAAHSFGLGSCLQGALANYPDAVREFLGLPRTKLLVIGMSMGYPDFAAPINTYQSTRVNLSDFVQWV